MGSRTTLHVVRKGINAANQGHASQTQERSYPPVQVNTPVRRMIYLSLNFDLFRLWPVPTSASDSLPGLSILIYTGWHVKGGYEQST
ncbi:hypothetical protein RU639_001182 [Aspergillus parasiticus]